MKIHSILLLVFVRASSSSNNNIVDVWERSKELNKQENWNRDIRKCKIKEVCPEHSKNCEDKVKWEKIGKKLESSAEVVVLDDRTMYQASFKHTLTQRDLVNLKEHLCDMTLIRRNAKDCLILWIPNQCPWEPFTEEAWPFSKDCDVKTINSEDAGSYPRDCSKGPGWNGTLETFVEGDSFKINWASLVKQPACVEQITLIDEKEHRRKRFITTLSDTNFPIEYNKSTCDLKIKMKMLLTESCFVTNARVKCETDLGLSEEPRLRGGFEDRETGSSTTMIVAIICLTVFAIVVVIAITLVILKKKKQRAELKKPKEQEKELNNRYGTYYRGVEYNIASDNNPRYNEDGGNAGAVITDENVYYQLGPDVPGESGGSCESVESGGFGGYRRC